MGRNRNPIIINNTESHNTPYCREVNITERRAPTDESVELLNEFQEKALDNIIQSFKIEDNTLKAVVVFYQSSIGAGMMNGQLCHIKFNLNGKDYFVKDIPVIDYDKAFGVQKFYHTLYKKFVEAITLEIMKDTHKVLEQLSRRNPY